MILQGISGTEELNPQRNLAPQPKRPSKLLSAPKMMPNRKTAMDAASFLAGAACDHINDETDTVIHKMLPKCVLAHVKGQVCCH